MIIANKFVKIHVSQNECDTRSCEGGHDNPLFCCAQMGYTSMLNPKINSNKHLQRGVPHDQVMV